MLIDGVDDQQQMLPGADAAHSTLTVTGEDLTRGDGQIDFSGFPFPAMPAEARVALMLLKYAWLGIVPMVIPSVLIDVPIPTNQIPSQQGTDLDYITSSPTRSATCSTSSRGPTPGMSIGYWGPQIKVGVPQPALNIDMDAHTNVEALSLHLRQPAARAADRSTSTTSYSRSRFRFRSRTSRRSVRRSAWSTPIPVKLETDRRRLEILDSQGGDDRHGQGGAHADAVKGEGSLDVLRYGRRAAGRAGSSASAAPAWRSTVCYYVQSVTHQIKRGEYKQRFKLARNGLISTLPSVPA